MKHKYKQPAYRIHLAMLALLVMGLLAKGVTASPYFDAYPAPPDPFASTYAQSYGYVGGIGAVAMSPTGALLPQACITPTPDWDEWNPSLPSCEIVPGTAWNGPPAPQPWTSSYVGPGQRAWPEVPRPLRSWSVTRSSPVMDSWQRLPSGVPGLPVSPQVTAWPGLPQGAPSYVPGLPTAVPGYRPPAMRDTVPG